ncbi:MAG: hypothetical protein RLZZ447_254 [Verrucomicrobiota bacterium]
MNQRSGWPRHPKLLSEGCSSVWVVAGSPAALKLRRASFAQGGRASRGEREPAVRMAAPSEALERRMAERGGFEPPVRLPVHMISNHAHSTTLSPLRGAQTASLPRSSAGRGDTQRAPRPRVNPQIRPAHAFRRGSRRTTTESDAQHSLAFCRCSAAPRRTLKGEVGRKCVLRERGSNPSLRRIFLRRRLTHHGHRQHRTRLQQQS